MLHDLQTRPEEKDFADLQPAYNILGHCFRGVEHWNGVPRAERYLGLFYRGRDCLFGNHVALHLPEPACQGSTERRQRRGVCRFSGDCRTESH